MFACTFQQLNLTFFLVIKQCLELSMVTLRFLILFVVAGFHACKLVLVHVKVVSRFVPDILNSCFLGPAVVPVIWLLDIPDLIRLIGIITTVFFLINSVGRFFIWFQVRFLPVAIFGKQNRRCGMNTERKVKVPKWKRIRSHESQYGPDCFCGCKLKQIRPFYYIFFGLYQIIRFWSGKICGFPKKASYSFK